MATTSVVPTVIDRIVAAVTAEMTGSLADVKTAQAWPGPEAKRRMFLLGETTWPRYAIATIKAGRKQRDERFSIEFEAWVLGTKNTTPSNPGPARDEAFAMVAEAENVLADDPSIGLGNTVQWVQIQPKSAGPRQFEKGGWAYRITGDFVALARLT